MSKKDDKKAQQALIDSRIKLYRDQAGFKKTERVPHFSAAVTWKVLDAGHTLDEAMTDFDLMESCVRHFLETYPVDGVLDTGIRNQFNVSEAFGQGYYYYTEEAVGIKDHAHCTLETLLEYQENPEKYVWEKVLPAKYPDWNEKTPDIWWNTFKEYWKYFMFILRMAGVQKEYGIPSLAPNNPSKGAIQFAAEELLANLLGIKQLSVAMRRGPEILDEFCQKWDEQHIDPIIKGVKEGKGANYKYCFDASVMMLVHNFLNPRQFERYYWPSLKRLYDAYDEKDMNARVFTEGSIGRYSDYFKDYKKGTLTFHIEQDDPFVMRKQLPNVAIMGGMTTEMLGNGTPEECVAYSKKLCDELAAEGGFIFSENKMLSYRNDAKAENYAAVCKFVSEYHM